MPSTDSQMIQQNLKCDVCVCMCLCSLSENHPSTTLKKHTIQITADFVYKPWSKEISPLWHQVAKVLEFQLQSFQ